MTDNKRIEQRRLEDVINDNKGLFGKPILDKCLWDQPDWDKLSEHARYGLKAMFVSYLFADGSNDSMRDLVVKGEEFLRNLAMSHIRKGLPQFVVTYHSPSCIRDVFLTLKHFEKYAYCFSLYPLNKTEEEQANDKSK